MQLLVIAFILIWAALVIKANDYSIKKIVDPTNRIIFFLPVLIIVFLITILRGVEVGIDHHIYLEISDRLAETEFRKIWTLNGVYMEPLLILIMKFCSALNYGLIPFNVVTTLLVLFIYYREFKNNSNIVWLSILITLAFGSYYTIFNGIAQFTTCILAFGASSFLYKGNFKKYLIYILLISLFHKTALFMIPMYFILRYRVSAQTHRRAAIVAMSFFALILSLLLFEYIVSSITPILFPEYSSKNLSSFDTAYSLTVVRPLIVVVFLLINKRYIDLNNIKERIWFNASIACLLMTTLSLKLGPMQRFSYFMLPYVALIVPMVISRITKKTTRFKYAITIVCILILYVIATTVIKDPGYTFLWQK